MWGSFAAWRISGEFETFPEQGAAILVGGSLQAWQRSGLTRTEYCGVHRLTKHTLDRWLKYFAGNEAARKRAEY
ncbi:IS66 family insertion sequence element accessory protein TnpA [Mesorhizobium sp. BH1-1-5]|uniref:IS66 family insertion sequence element accessory protein TnpA n=1 Tax=Mesorhizobium sp. BH1-1-5 TaxID=2876661 RepID=UPI00398E6BBD